MDLRPWPERFFEKKRSDTCVLCDGPADDEDGALWFEGTAARAYVRRVTPSLGYTAVVFHGRHVVDLHEMTAGEHAAFWSEVGQIAQAIYEAFAPIHFNYQVLGNEEPHIHVHVVPRYDPDPAPSLPLPPEVWAASVRLDDATLATQAAALQNTFRVPGLVPDRD